MSTRDPIAVGLVKSKGVPETAASSPVGINVESTGVYRSASTCKRWLFIVPLPSPFKLKKA
jgi:hypothetical protein